MPRSRRKPIHLEVTGLAPFPPTIEEWEFALLEPVLSRLFDEPQSSGAYILRLEKCLWVFVDVPGVEPTNNYGERTIRQGVIYRKLSFGTRSESGSRFIERTLTVETTLKQQKRNPLEFLTQALWAHRRGLPPPSLLPASDSAQATVAA
jgi:transposase